MVPPSLSHFYEIHYRCVGVLCRAYFSYPTSILARDFPLPPALVSRAHPRQLTVCYFLEHFSPGGFVGEHEAGQRLFQVAHDPRCAKSGVYWSWNGGPREGRGVEALEKGGQISGGGGAGGGWDSIFENDQSAKVLDVETAIKLFEYSTDVTGAEWPNLKAVTSPCPTLNVIGAVTKGMVKREEMKRMREMGRPGIVEGQPIKLSKRKKAVLVADKVVGFTLKNTLGRGARFLGRRLLGKIPEEALTGSFVESGPIEKVVIQDAASMEGNSAQAQKLVIDVAKQLKPVEVTLVVDSEDEALFQQIFDEDSGTTSKKAADEQNQRVAA